MPRHSLRTVVAHLISDALDREVTVTQLWSGRTQPTEFWVPVDHGLQLPWTAEGTVEVLDNWLRHARGAIGLDRRFFLAVSGAALTAPAWSTPTTSPPGPTSPSCRRPASVRSLQDQLRVT